MTKETMEILKEEIILKLKDMSIHEKKAHELVRALLILNQDLAKLENNLI